MQQQEQPVSQKLAEAREAQARAMQRFAQARERVSRAEEYLRAAHERQKALEEIAQATDMEADTSAAQDTSATDTTTRIPVVRKRRRSQEPA